MTKHLFDEFTVTSPKQWKHKIQVDLKGESYNETLIWKSEEGIDVRPFYTKEDRTKRKIKIPNKFNICQNIFIDNESKANKLAVDSLNKGANSICFSTTKKIDYKKILKNIDISKNKIFFNFSFLSINLIENIYNYYKSKNIFFNTDIINNLVKTGNWFINFKNDFKSINKTIPNSINVNTSTYQNAGASITQQLAYGLAHANEYLNYFGSDIANKIHFKFSVGSNYFFEIAKLRAFRILWASLLEQYQISNEKIQIFVKPSLRNKTIYDYNVNMLRTTSECMSAILGGANTISNISYDKIFHKSNEFGERISRNQLLILQNESNFLKNNNVANGCYYIETITDQLAEKSLEIFKLIEKGGGFLKQLKEGSIQRKIKENAQKQQNLFDKGELVLLGTNKIQNHKDMMKNNLELYPFIKKRSIKTIIKPIVKKRLSESIERERLKNE